MDINNTHIIVSHDNVDMTPVGGPWGQRMMLTGVILLAMGILLAMARVMTPMIPSACAVIMPVGTLLIIVGWIIHGPRRPPVYTYVPCDRTGAPYGPGNPAPGSQLWNQRHNRTRQHPEAGNAS